MVTAVLAWADAWKARTGRWPLRTSGPVPESPGDTWMAVSLALAKGHRGLPGGSSLARLLAQRRSYRNVHGLPPLTARVILGWADAHREATGRWPTLRNGPVGAAPGESWACLDQALRHGGRGLPGGDSIARLLARRRGVRNRGALPHLTRGLIRAWAERHRRRTGRWPTADSGRVAGAPGETWGAVDSTLRQSAAGYPAAPPWRNCSASPVAACRRPTGRPSPAGRASGRRRRGIVHHWLSLGELGGGGAWRPPCRRQVGPQGEHLRRG